MVMDLQAEEEQKATLKQALTDAREAQRLANETADLAIAGEQQAMMEVERMLEEQVMLTDALDDFKRKFEAGESQNRQLRQGLSAAQQDLENEKRSYSHCASKLRHELADAVSHQQELLSQCTDKDEQVGLRPYPCQRFSHMFHCVISIESMA